MPEILSPEDYVEPRCLLCDEPYGAAPQPVMIPRARVLEKLDDYMAKRAFDDAERHLRYWLSEAQAGRDKQGQFQILNEMMGCYRKLGRGDEALDAAEKTLALAKEMRIDDAVSGATAALNAATVCDAFGKTERSLELFRAAKTVFERDLPEDDPRLGGLYNNMGLSLVSAGLYDEAEAIYRRALSIMAHAPRGRLEQAITYLNLADAVYARLGAEEAEETVGDCLDKAEALLSDPAEARDGYYAFVCEKCASAFRYHGRFAFASELEKRAEEIYAGA